MEAEINQTPEHIEDLQRKNKFTGTVTKIMLAGAIIDIGMEVPGVLHISQIQKEPVNRIEDVLEIGQSVEVWVKRIFPKKKRIEFTMIEPLELEWREIKEGMTTKGKVTRLEKYGAFVDIGAERPGLVHISELAHGYIRTPEDAVHEGDEIDVKVLSVNRRKKQIKLSIKALLEDPSKIVQRVNKESEEEAESNTPVPTAMEMAMRQAMERSQQDEEEEVEEPSESKKLPQVNDELEDMLSRTLDHKVKTSSK